MKKGLSIVFIILFLSLGFFSFVQAEETDSQALVQTIQEQINALQARIAEMQKELEQLVGQAKELEKAIQFTQTLTQGVQNEEVRQLQELLAQDPEIYPEKRITGFFGSATRQAVKRFQEKYREDILAPLGFREGTGIVGQATRAKLNELYGGTVSTAPAVPATPATPAVPGETPAAPATPAIPAIPPTVTTATTSPVTPPSVPAKPYIAIISPNGGERLLRGSTYDITWKSGLLGKVNIELASSSGSNFQNQYIAFSVPSSQGKYSWSVSQSLGANYKIFIWDAEGTIIDSQDYSDNYFSIVATTTIATTTAATTTPTITPTATTTPTTATTTTQTQTQTQQQTSTQTTTPAPTTTTTAAATTTVATSTTTTTTSTATTTSGDTTPPGNLQSFSGGAISGGRISLDWANPLDSDFAGVKIVRKAGAGSTQASITSISDGTVVYTGSGTSFIDTDVTGGITYWYRVFTFDQALNYSSGGATIGAAVQKIPVISNIQASNITENSAAISWTTDWQSYGMVDYGLSASYGSTFEIPRMGTELYHQATLANLTSATIYHYRVRSPNALWEEAQSGDQTFTTASPAAATTTTATTTTATTTGSRSFDDQLASIAEAIARIAQEIKKLLGM